MSSPKDQSSTPRSTSSRARAGSSARPLSRPATPRRAAPQFHNGQSQTPPHLPPSPQPGPRTETPTAQFPATTAHTKPGAVRIPSAQRPSNAPSHHGEPQRRSAPHPRHKNAALGRTRLTRRGKCAVAVACLAFLLVILVAWPVGLGLWANGRIHHVDALSGAADTPGTTTLIAGADIAQGKAQRTDTIMLLHKAPNGKKYHVSIPRDTLVEIPGHGKYKINAAYAIGGAPLLVKTVEQFTGLTVDHLAVIGFDGVTEVVDSVGTVNLCIDQDVDDPKSGLKMKKGCHDVGGEQALAFVRARAFDPTADIGRQKRQQQFVTSLSKRIFSPDVLLNPFTHVSLASAGTNALITDTDTGLVDLGFSVLTMKDAMADGQSMHMPVEDPEFRTKHSGIAIKVDDEKIDAFFRSIEDGSATPTKKS